MCKSILYAANELSQPIVATGTTINFGNEVRRYGIYIDALGGNVVLNGAGYYNVDANITFTADAIGVVVVQLYKDGVPITGAKASVGTLADITYAITIPAVVRDLCCKDSVITAVISGVAGTVDNAGIVVEKV